MSNVSPCMNFRSFVDELRQRHDLVDIRQTVDANLEIGAITRKVYEDRAPAPLFASIRDAQPGFRVLGAPAGLNRQPGEEFGRLALHFGLPKSATPRDIVERIIAASHASPVTPRIVDTGPCKENIWRGSQVDLTRFPVPLLHAADGGKYFGTYGFHIVQSPDRTWDSWSVARSMLHDRNTLVGPAMPQQHLGMIREMWKQRGEPTPWAMALGAPPAALAVAGMPLPEHVSESGYVGAMVGDPVEVVKAETNDLLVPANAEIILEGTISLSEKAMEGPMGEYHGYSFPVGREQPLFHVEAVTFRNEAILPICAAGLPPEENHTIWGTMISAQALDLLRRANMPVDMAWCSYEAATCWIVLSIDTARLQTMQTDASRFVHLIADILFSSHAGWLVPKVILVSNDIDITDIDQVVWALATRHHPARDHFAFPEATGIPLVPYLSPEEKAAGSGGKAIINCLFPEQFRGDMRATVASFDTSFPEELKRSVLANWTAYGFPA